MAEHPRPRRRVPTMPAGVGVVGVLALSVRIVPGHPVTMPGSCAPFSLRVSAMRLVWGIRFRRGAPGTRADGTPQAVHVNAAFDSLIGRPRLGPAMGKR